MAELDASNNPLTADDTYTFEIIPGVPYVIGAAGTWGGGSLAIGWQDEEGTVTAFDESPLTADGSFSFVAAAGIVSMTLSGSTDASIRIQTADTQGNDTTASILQKLQGAEADATKIGAEYMPDIIPVDGVTLADSSAVELPAGTLGLNADNRLVIHDADTTGGVDAMGMVLKGAAALTVSDSLATEQTLEIARVIIPAAYFANLDTIVALGTIVVQSDLLSYNPATNPGIVLYFRDAAGNRNATAEPGDGYRCTIATAATPAAYTIVEVTETFQVALALGQLTLSLLSITGATRMRTLATGAATETETLFVNSGTTGERPITYGGAGGFAYLCIGLYLPDDAATADATGIIRAACNIELFKV